MKNVFKGWLSKGKGPKTTTATAIHPSIVQEDNGGLIKIESGWPDKEYELFVGQTIKRLRALIGNLTFNKPGQETLLQATLTTALLASRFADGKVLKSLIVGGDRIRCSKIQKSITIIATIIDYLSQELSRVEVFNKAKKKWLYTQDFNSFTGGAEYQISYNDTSEKNQESFIRAKLTVLLLDERTLEHFDTCGPDYANILFNLTTRLDYEPLSSSIKDAINRNKIGQLTVTKVKKKKVDKKSQLIELLNQLIRNGRANEPGSKVWLSTEGLYFLFPQAANDIRALAKKLNVELPKDTLQLVKMLNDYDLLKIPAIPINSQTPYYKKISITSQGVPKKPQLAIHVGNEKEYVGGLLLEPVEIKEVVQNNAPAPEQKPIMKESLVEDKVKNQEPIEKLLEQIKEEDALRIKGDEVVVYLGDLKPFVESPLHYMRDLEKQGVGSGLQIEAQNPSKTSITVSFSKLKEKELHA